jgi:gluconate:H+ symporter, GntP family
MDSVTAVAGQTLSYWPLVVLGISMVFIIVGIAVLRIHPFLVLSLAAILVGLMSSQLPGVPPLNPFVQAVELSMSEFGRSAGSIAFVILLAAIIGMSMLESGAADKIVRRSIAVLGEKRAPLALLGSGFFLSIPVFFDTVFFLLIPLARALALRTGRNYILYVLAICTGGVITHVLVAPTPGPLLVAEMLRPLGLDLGTTMVAGILAGVIPAVCMLYLARWLDVRVAVPLRETPGASLADLQAIVDKKDDELPPFLLSVMPVLLPVLMIAAASFMGLAQTSLPGVVSLLGGETVFDGIKLYVDFAGNKNVAMLTGTAIAIYILVRQKSLGLQQVSDSMGPPLETAGVIILITAAGGAFGAMIRHSGVGDVIKHLADGYGVNYVLLAWIVAAVIRVAQGSGTVAMITAAGLMAAILGDGQALTVHPIYVFLAIGFGALFGSWMNDSGFWVVGKLSGFTESETLKTWTVLTVFVSLVGLFQVLLMSWVFPLR